MIGSLNPCPFRCGGGQTPSSKAYGVIRRMVGDGGSAADDLGIDGLWRRSRAKGIAAISSTTTRATLQAYPHLATDALPYYGRVLGLTQGSHETEADFRIRLWEGWVARIRADVPSLATDLLRIDSRTSILEQSYSTTTMHGRAFAPLWTAGEAPAFGGSGHTMVPNYSTSFVVYVQLTLGYAGAPSLADQRILERIREYLRNVLPSWISFAVITSTGFILDSSPLDLTGLS